MYLCLILKLVLALYSGKTNQWNSLEILVQGKADWARCHLAAT
jgi:hypothetical protein